MRIVVFDRTSIPEKYKGKFADAWYAGFIKATQSPEPAMPLLSPVGFLTQVEDLLDMREWDASTIETVAELARLAGAEIRDPDEIDTRSPEWIAGYDHGRAQCNHHPVVEGAPWIST